MKLVVTQLFGAYAVGQEITEPEEIEAVLGSHPNSVVKVAVAPAEAPADVRTPPAPSSTPSKRA